MQKAMDKTMSKNVIWAVEGSIKEGQRAALNTVMHDMIEVTSKEVGSLNYEWTLAEDGSTIHIYERYADEAAAKAHLTTWGKNAARFIAAVDISRVVIYSSVSEELKASFAGAVMMTPIGGFAK